MPALRASLNVRGGARAARCGGGQRGVLERPGDAAPPVARRGSRSSSAAPCRAARRRTMTIAIADQLVAVEGAEHQRLALRPRAPPIQSANDGIPTSSSPGMSRHRLDLEPVDGLELGGAVEGHLAHDAGRRRAPAAPATALARSRSSALSRADTSNPRCSRNRAAVGDVVHRQAAHPSSRRARSGARRPAVHSALPMPRRRCSGSTPTVSHGVRASRRSPASRSRSRRPRRAASGAPRARGGRHSATAAAVSAMVREHRVADLEPARDVALGLRDADQ